MRNTQIGISILIVSVLYSCKSEPIEPFELLVADYNYSLAYSILYKLTDKELTITFRGELENEKDSILYSITELPKRKIRKLSKINLDSLKTFYSNICISDGDIKVYRYTRNLTTKQIQVQNYYQEDLSPAIELINSIVPEKFTMHYDKAELLANQKWCDDDRKEFSKKEN